MATTQIGYSCVEIATGNEIAHSQRLPFSPQLPNKNRGRIATFDKVGQLAGDGAYKCAERWIIERPNAHYVKGTEEKTFDGGTKLTIDPGWTFTGLQGAVDRAKRDIKATAGDLIVAFIPAWKQRNRTARATILLAKGMTNLTVDEQAEWDAGEAIWDNVVLVRAHSDTLEVEIDAIVNGVGTDEEKAAAIVAYQASNWPSME